MAQTPSQTFGKYQILERIATGGMAEIYKARLEGIGGFQRTFAIKRILPHLSLDAEYVAMLVDEAKVAGLLSHANIVQILDLGQVDKVWYIAMEFVEGRDLGGVLKRARERGLMLPVPHACFVALELLKGLEYAHQRQVMRGGRQVPLNIIHRDVSPPNVLLSFQGEVKLTDFGIARASLKAAETQAGIIKGRFDYMSPEQAAGSRELDQRSDLFAVGVVLYEMLTGHHPFRQDSEFATLEAVREGKYTPASQHNPDVPYALQTIVDRALRVDKAERFGSATAFKDALDKFFHESGFVFTHTTLSSYLKSLFPEATGKRSPVSPKPLDGRRSPLPMAPVVDDVTEGPTKIIDAKLINEEIERQQSARFGIQAPEESTEVHPVPLMDSDYTTRPELDPWDEGEQPTVIKPSPMADSVRPPSRLESLSVPAVAVHDVSTVDQQLSEPLRSEHSARAKKKTTRGGGISVPAVLVLVLVAGGLSFVVGGAITAGVLASLRTVEAPALARPPGEARLRVLVPGDLEAKVDGKSAVGSLAVTPDQPVHVTVERGGVVAWEQDVVVHAGEERVILVTAPVLEEP